MLDKIDIKIARDNLINILGDYKKSSERIITDNKETFLKTLTPGAQVPYHVPLDNDHRKELDTAIQDTRTKFKNTIAPLLDTLKKDVATAPSTEATNTIALLNMRTNIDANEIEFLMNQYGNNVQCYKAIKDIARKHDINNFTENETIKQYDNLSNLYISLDSWNTTQAESMTGGLLSMYELDINNALGIED